MSQKRISKEKKRLNIIKTIRKTSVSNPDAIKIKIDYSDSNLELLLDLGDNSKKGKKDFYNQLSDKLKYLLSDISKNLDIFEWKISIHAYENRKKRNIDLSFYISKINNKSFFGEIYFLKEYSDIEIDNHDTVFSKFINIPFENKQQFLNLIDNHKAVLVEYTTCSNTIHIKNEHMITYDFEFKFKEFFRQLKDSNLFSFEEYKLTPPSINYLIGEQIKWSMYTNPFENNTKYKKEFSSFTHIDLCTEKDFIKALVEANIIHCELDDIETKSIEDIFMNAKIINY